MSIISVKNIYKKYKHSDYFALNDLSLDIPKQEIFGVLGPNGAGKTTLLSILSGIIKPTTGECVIKKMNYSHDRKTIQQLIGVVPQEYSLYFSLSAYQNLEYFGHMYGLKGKELKDSIHRHLEILGLINYKDKRVSTFSGGMKRRLNLIAGVLHAPEILFLDEPTVGVDIQSKANIMDYLSGLHQTGTDIIYTSHHLLEAEQFCTQIAIIDAGKIKAVGSPKDLITMYSENGNLEDVFLNLTGKQLRDYA